MYAVVYVVNTSMNLCWPSSSLSVGQLNVKNEELEAMIKEASGPINFTVFLTMFGEKLKGMQKSLSLSVFPLDFQSLLYSVSVIRSLRLWKVLTPKTSSCLPSRCWIPRALAPSRSSCESIFTDFLFPCGKKKKKFSYLLFFHFHSSLEELLTTQCDRFSAEEVRSDVAL